MGRALVRGCGLVLAVVATLPACQADGSPTADGARGSTPTTSSGTTASTDSATSIPGGDQRCSPGGSSPSEFDPTAGLYAVYLMGVDLGQRSVAFDVVQFLVGDAATDAYHRDFPSDPEGPPNDYYIVNANPTARSASVARDVEVLLVRLHEDGDADLDEGSFDELPSDVTENASSDDPRRSANPFWLTFDDGTVTRICEQYVP